MYACSKSYHVFWLLIRWVYISVRKGSYKFISLYYLCFFLLKLVINHSYYSVDGLSWVVRLDDVFMYVEALPNIRV